MLFGKYFILVLLVHVVMLFGKYFILILLVVMFVFFLYII